MRGVTVRANPLVQKEDMDPRGGVTTPPVHPEPEGLSGYPGSPPEPTHRGTEGKHVSQGGYHTSHRAYFRHWGPS